MFSTSSAFLTLSLLTGVLSQQLPTTATPLSLQTVDAQYQNEGFQDPDQTKGFGTELKSQVLVTAVYGDQVVGAEGKSLTKDQVASLPQVYITPSNETARDFANPDQSFTLMLADASAVGHPDPEGNFRHYLANGIKPSAPPSDTNLTSLLSGGQTITNYAGPGPNAGEGPHRYAWLVFQQPSDFSPPSDLSQPGTSPSHFSVSSYVQSSHLGDLVGAAFFTVENGQASYSVGPTSSVDAKTLPAASETGASGSSSGSAAGASASADGDSGSGAMKVGASVAGVGFVGAAMMALI